MRQLPNGDQKESRKMLQICYCYYIQEGIEWSPLVCTRTRVRASRATDAVLLFLKLFEVRGLPSCKVKQCLKCWTVFSQTNSQTGRMQYQCGKSRNKEKLKGINIITYKWRELTWKRRESGKGREGRRSGGVNWGRPFRVERRREGVSIGVGQLPKWRTPVRALPPLHAFTANFISTETNSFGFRVGGVVGFYRSLLSLLAANTRVLWVWPNFLPSEK